MKIWRRLAVAGLVVGLGGVAAGRVQAQRLLGGVRPEHYSLTIAPDLKAATFAGSETIAVVLDAPTTTIMLNAAEIEFGAVKAWSREQGTGNREQQKTDDSSGVALDAVVTLDEAKEQATFTFARELPAGRVRLAIEY